MDTISRYDLSYCLGRKVSIQTNKQKCVTIKRFAFIYTQYTRVQKYTRLQFNLLKVGENLHQSVVLQGVVFMAYHTPGVQIYIQCAKIHPSSNVAHEHGFRIRLHVTQDKRQSQARPSGRPANSKSRGPVFDPHLGCRVVSLSKTH